MAGIELGFICLVGFTAAFIITKNPRFIIGMTSSIAVIITGIVDGIRDDWM